MLWESILLGFGFLLGAMIGMLVIWFLLTVFESIKNTIFKGV